MPKPIKGQIKKKQIIAPNLSEQVGSVVQLVGEMNSLKSSVDNKLEQIDSKFETIKDEFEEIKNIQKGEKGESVDPYEVAQIVLNNIELPKDGKDADEDAIVEKLVKRLPKPLDEKKLAKSILSQVPDRKADLKIIQENIEIDPMSVIEKIMELPEEKRAKLKLKNGNVDGLDQTISSFRNQLARGYLHGGGLSTVSTDATLTGNGTSTNPLSVVGGGGSGGNYTPQGVTTFTAGGLPSGTNLGTTPVTVQSILDLILYAFIPPTFSSFAITQSTPVEVGTTISGVKAFTFGFSNPANVTANSMEILDVTGGTSLASGLALSSPQNANVGSVTLILPGTYSWKGRATDTNTNTFDSSLSSVTWQWREYWGTQSNPTLNASDITSLANSALASSFSQTRAFVAGDYKYIVFPDSFGSPTAVNGFFDPINNFNVAMATVADNAAYSNVQNGWYYDLVSVTNVNGIATNYRVYRTKNVLGGTFTIRVQ